MREVVMLCCPVVSIGIYMKIHCAPNRTSPPRGVRENYARGIVAMFPYLMDPYSKNGYVGLFKLNFSNVIYIFHFYYHYCVTICKFTFKND